MSEFPPAACAWCLKEFEQGSQEIRDHMPVCQSSPLFAALELIQSYEALVVKIDLMLRVPAAEYVPAIRDVFDLLDKEVPHLVRGKIS